MSGDFLGGGVIVVVAAGLWIAYLIPTVMRRREYMATERNALRLQQTMRILAETAEIPHQVRVELTARSVVAQERILRHSEERVKAEARAAEAKAVAEAVAATSAANRATAAAEATIAAERRRAGAAAASRALLRRARAATSLILLAAVVAIGWGVYQIGAIGSWSVLMSGAVAAVIGILVLGRLARAGRTAVAAPVAVATPVAAELYDHAEAEEAALAVRSAWTPTPLPKPLHLSRGTIAASSMASMDAATELRRAAARADLAARAADIVTGVTPLRRPAATERPIAEYSSRFAAADSSRFAVVNSSRFAVVNSSRFASADSSRFASADSSRFAAMGRVEDLDGASIDLDEALRRRRAVG